MKILIVRNNPQNLATSNLNKLERFFLRFFDGKNAEMIFIDLYRDINFFRINKEIIQFFKSKNKGDFKKEFHKKWETKKSIAKTFAWADKVLIVSPYWTGLFPSALKDWIDLLPLEDVTLFYSKNKKWQKGKKTNKEIFLLQTCGDVMKRNKISNFGKELIKNVMNFYGAKKFTHFIAESSYSNRTFPNQKEKQEIEKIAKRWIKEIKE